MLLLFLLFGGLGAVAHTTSIRCDFENGMPAGFAMYDLDGLSPSKDLTQYDFATGNPWVIYFIENDNNHVAASTSWYSPSGTANDWLVTPAMTVESAEVTLSWDARATHSKYRDGYAVYITEDGAASPTESSWTEVFSVTSEENAWTHHSLSLAAYEGKTISIAFVNNSKNCNVLYLDNIIADELAPINVKINSLPFIKAGEALTLNGQVVAESTETINGFTVGYIYNGQEYTKTFNTTLQPGERLDFSFETDITLADNEKAVFDIFAKTEDTKVEKEFNVTGHNFVVVGEELTGNWCGFCVRGIVALENMRANYPDTFIGIACHGDDFLTDDDYFNVVVSYTGLDGYPASVTGRNVLLAGDPRNFEEHYLSLQQNPLRGYITLDITPSDEGFALTSHCSVDENCEDGRYAVEYIIMEDDVFEEGNKNYKQHNSYSGGEYGEMGGFENLPEYVTDFHFQDVARGVMGDANGIQGSLPKSITAGTNYVYTTTLEMPETILNEDNVYVVAMLIDTSVSRGTREMNAIKVKLNDNPSTSGINDLRISLNGDGQNYNLQGMKVGSNYHGIIIRDGKKYIQK